MADAETRTETEVTGRNEAKERLNELLSRLDYADAHRAKHVERYVDWFKLYCGYRDKIEDPRLQDRSNIHVPMAYQAVDTLRSRLVKSFFGTSRPYVDFVPFAGYRATVETLNEAEQKADVAAALVDQQFERNNMVKVFYDYCTALGYSPLTIMSVGWRRETRKVRKRVPLLTGQAAIMINRVLSFLLRRKFQMPTRWADVEEVVWDDNEIRHVDLCDFWWDPRGATVDECRYVFHREWASRAQIEAQLDLLDKAGGGTFYEVDWEAVTGAGAELVDGKWERLEAVGLSPEPGDAYAADPAKKTLYEVLHYWEDTRHAIVINRAVVAFDGPNPYSRHGLKPFVAAAWEPIPGDLAGLSIIGLMERLNHAIDTMVNQRIDNISLGLNRMWVLVESMGPIDESQLVSRPHGVIKVKLPGQVEALNTPDITAGAFNETAMLQQHIENTLALPAPVRGATAQRRETATAVVTTTSGATIRHDVKILLAQALGIKPLVSRMDLNNQQFISHPRVVRLLGEEGPAAWRSVDPEDIQGEWDYLPAGASVDPSANKEVRRAQLREALEVALKTGNPYENVEELTREYMNSFDFRNPRKFSFSQQQVEERALQMKLRELQQAYTIAQATRQLQQQAQLEAQAQALAGGQVAPGVAGPGGIGPVGPAGAPEAVAQGAEAIPAEVMAAVTGMGMGGVPGGV